MTETDTKKLLKRVNSLEKENQNLREELSSFKQVFSNMKEKPLIIGSIERVLEDGRMIVSHAPGNRVLVPPNELLDPHAGDQVTLHAQSYQIIEILSRKIRGHVAGMELIESPNVTFEDIGGLDAQIQAIREVVELPLLNPELFEEIGIDPPSGALLSGPPGTGKTLLAKAIARSSNARFIHLVGSDLVQKFIGEGSRMVREVFTLAKENIPAIIFIDEIDAIAIKRTSEVYKGDREVQRTFMQLLSELDGFADTQGIMFIAATNREDVLDPAILRPGRFDRIIRFDLPNEEAREMILKIHTRKMKLENVDFKTLARKTEGFSGAHIKALVTEAGIKALRERRKSIKHSHFNEALVDITDKEHSVKDYIYT
ncbi:MAG: AAA family ATPase [Candidatus Lokiarchaeota archaeon]|nr:AAA family ATPase [Candidatus Lokiarchaeota archaeon]MBD3200720.1 AAA family ATPase [Candidatus Lokiarchaeota archaeon]